MFYRPASFRLNSGFRLQVCFASFILLIAFASSILDGDLSGPIIPVRELFYDWETINPHYLFSLGQDWLPALEKGKGDIFSHTVRN